MARSDASTAPAMICSKCGYILDHLPEKRCPECGRTYEAKECNSLGSMAASKPEANQHPNRGRRWLRYLVLLSVSVSVALVAILLLFVWQESEPAEFLWFLGFAMVFLGYIYALVFGVIVGVWVARHNGFDWGIRILFVPCDIGAILATMRDCGALWPLWWFAGIAVAIAGVVLMEISGVEIRILPW